MQDRIKKLQEILDKKKIENFLVTDPVSIVYLTGFCPSFGKLYIQKKAAYLFVDGRYLEEAKKNASCTVCPLETEKVFLKKLKSKKIYLDENTTTLGFFEKIKKQSAACEFKPIASFVTNLRMIKDVSEIALMKKAAKLAYRGYKHILSILKEGMSEKEVALAFEIFCRTNGAEKLSFDPIIAFGKNSAVPHHKPCDDKLKKNMLVLMDLGVVVDGYCSDMTRVHFFGRIDPKLVFLDKTVLAAQQAAFALCRPGVKIKELDKAARAVMKKAKAEKLFIHGLGHGVGLEIHEKPSLKKESLDQDLILKEGMVITIEPGLYIPKLGGIRHEDTICITKKGYENFYPR